jgi:hypothetical protein
VGIFSAALRPVFGLFCSTCAVRGRRGGKRAARNRAKNGTAQQMLLPVSGWASTRVGGQAQTAQEIGT